MTPRAWHRTRQLLTAALLAAASGCVFRTTHTADEVERAVRATGIIGASRDSALKLLRGVRLENGDSLEVGDYPPPDLTLTFGIENVSRRWFTTWHLNGYVHFDSTRHAVNVAVEAAATGVP